MTLPEKPTDPREVAEDILRRTRALSTACHFARATPDEHSFRVMVTALVPYSTKEIENAVASIAADPPAAPTWIPSAEIAKRVKSARLHRRDVENGIDAGKKTDPAQRVSKDALARIVGKLQAADAEAGGPERRRRDGGLTDEQIRETEIHLAKLKERNAAKGFVLRPADDTADPKPRKRKKRGGSARGAADSSGSGAGASS